MAFEHYDKCSLLLPMDGANNGTVFTDWSVNQKTVTAFGNAKTVTSDSKYYGSSLYLDGNGDYLQLSSGFNFGTGDFTLGAWIKSPFATTLALISGYTSSSVRWFIGLTSNSVYLYYNQEGATTDIILNDALGSTEFHYIEITRVSGVVYVSVDGVKQVNSATFSMSLFGGTVPLIGARYTGSSFTGFDFVGNINDLFVLDGIALHTDDFTPPARLIAELSNANAASPVEDESGTTVERRIFVVPRCYPTRMFTTESDSNGDFTLRAPAVECSVIALHEGSPAKNDLIYRVTPV